MSMDPDAIGGLVGLFIALVFIALILWTCGRISRKAGFSGWWSLLMLIPLVNIVMIWVFAFVEWPAEIKQANVAEVFE
ncbi:hypothetical protein [Pelagibius marinus]|uniref:hypothetical protein n=1 Tax=Pelagibius marinus TaxID=2762760 RepID=UPI001D03B4AA|nr:hypothetical protein [Pelagibius marinus]